MLTMVIGENGKIIDVRNCIFYYQCDRSCPYFESCDRLRCCKDKYPTEPDSLFIPCEHNPENK